MKSNISCVKSRALLQYVEARNPEQLPMLWRFCEKEAGEEGPEHFFSNPDNKMSLDLCTTLMDLTKKATSDEMAAFKAAYRFGRSAHREQKAGFFSSPFGLMKDLLREAQKTDRLPGKKIEFVTASETHVIVRVHWPKGLNLTRDYCLFEQGLYQALPMEHGLPPARLWERTCFFEGGLYCEYEMWWGRPETAKKPSLKLFFSRKEKTGERPDKLISPATTAGNRETVEDPGAGGSSPVPATTAVHCDTSNSPIESRFEADQALSTTTPDTTVSILLESPDPSAAPDTTTESEPEEAVPAREETRAPVPQNAGDEESKTVEVGERRQVPATPSEPVLTQNQQPPVSPEPKPTEQEVKPQQDEQSLKEMAPARAKKDFNQEEAVFRQLGHLFKGLSTMVALMLSETNMDHPKVEHLKRMEDMLCKGDALRRRLRSVSDTDVGPATDCEEKSAPQGAPITGDNATARATILLVEDLEALRNRGKKLLCALGFDVLVAADGHQAMDVFKDISDRIDLVIMDMTMSVATVKEMKDIKPAIKIFFSNSELTEEAQRTVRSLGCEGLIKKPFSIYDLHRNLRVLLLRKHL